MYAIIREGNGQFYTSMVFGFYMPSKDDTYKDRYWIVLNKEKTALIKKNALQQNTKYLIPMILITDADESNWVKLGEDRQSIDFLPTAELLSLIDHHQVPEALTRRCIEMDSTYSYEPMKAVQTPEDIRDLKYVSGGFHDGEIVEMKEEDDQLYLLFDRLWGCKMEIWFEGDIAYDVTSRDPEMYDPYWFGSTVLLQNGFVYLIDDENATVEGITVGDRWFRGRSMKYRVIPE